MKKTFFYLTLLLFCLVNSTTVLSQDDELTAVSSKDDSRAIQFAVKFAPVQMLSGQFNFSFESAIHKRGSLELSIGPTFGSVGFAVIDMYGITNNNLFVGNSQVGINTSLGYRFYVIKPKNTNLAGLYLSPVFKYNLLRTSVGINNQDDLTSVTNAKSKSNLMLFTIQTGYQFVFTSGLVLDMFIGTGFGHRNLRAQQVYSIYDGGELVDFVYPTTKKEFYVAFTTGLRIGFGSKFNSGK